MTVGPVKHSLTLNGHRTSVSLEPEFWRIFVQLATSRGVSVNALAAELDLSRQGGLASSLRVFVLSQILGGFTPQVLPEGKTSPQDI